MTCPRCHKRIPLQGEPYRQLQAARKQPLAQRYRAWWAYVDTLCRCPEQQHSRVLLLLDRVLANSTKRR